MFALMFHQTLDSSAACSSVAVHKKNGESCSTSKPAGLTSRHLVVEAVQHISIIKHQYHIQC